jgi:hypothetical protein
MSELKNLLKQIKTTEALAEMTLEGTDWRTLPGRTSQKAQAKVELEKLETQYKDMLSKSVVTILVTGKNSEKFASLSKVSQDCIVVDYLDFYKKVSVTVEASLSKSRMFGVTQHLLLMQRLGDFNRAYEILSNPPDMPVADVYVATVNDVISEIANRIESANGLSVVKTYIEEDVAYQASIKEEFSKVVPVVILNAPASQHDEIIRALFKGKGVSVDTENVETDEKLIIKTFQQIQKNLKGNN